jgi:hypothetical protein
MSREDSNIVKRCKTANQEEDNLLQCMNLVCSFLSVSDNQAVRRVCTQWTKVRAAQGPMLTLATSIFLSKRLLAKHERFNPRDANKITTLTVYHSRWPSEKLTIDVLNIIRTLSELTAIHIKSDPTYVSPEFCDDTFFPILRAILPTLPKLRTMTFSTAYCGAQNGLRKFTQLRNSGFFDQLTALHLKEPFADMKLYLSIFKQLPTLSDLSLKNWRCFEDDEDDETCLPTLRRLRVDGWNPHLSTALIHKTSGLTCLELKHPQRLPDSATANLTNLASLSTLIFNNSCLSITGILDVSSNCFPSLEHLVWKPSSTGPSQVITELIEVLATQLVSLFASDCQLPKETTFPKLRALYLAPDSSGRVPIMSFDLHSLNAPNLEQLWLAGFYSVSTRDLSHFPKLTTLALHSAKLFDDDDLRLHVQEKWPVHLKNVFLSERSRLRIDARILKYWEQSMNVYSNSVIEYSTWAKDILKIDTSWK